MVRSTPKLLSSRRRIFKSLSKLLKSLVCIAALLGSPTILADDIPAPRLSLEKIKASGKLRLAALPEQDSSFLAFDFSVATPKEQADLEKVPLVGADAEILGLLATHLGVELELVLPEVLTTDGTVGHVALGKGDIGAGNISITESRARRVDFSRSYYTTALAAVARSDKPIKTLDEAVGKRVAMPAGSAVIAHWRKLMGKRPYEEVFIDGMTIGIIAAVVDGYADLSIDDEAVMRSMTADLPAAQITMTLDIDDHYGFAFPKNSELKAECDRFLENLEKSGKLAEIIRRHLGTD